MKICLISVEIFAWGKYGGFGRATRTIGRELAKRGHEVFVVVPRHGNQRQVERLDGMTVLGFTLGWPPSAEKMLRQCDANIYHSCEPSFATYLAMRVMPARRHMVTVRDPRTLRDWKMEFDLPSLNKLQVLHNFLYENNWLVQRCLRRMDAVYTTAQSLISKVQSMYGLAHAPEFLPTPVAIPVHVEKADTPTVCYLARLDRRKRPEIFLDLAKKFPNTKFIALGKSRDPRWEAELRKQAAIIPNLEMAGFVDQFTSARHSEILHQSWVMVNTATREGLPNAFLEAAAHECAILSGVNPDGFASRFGHHVQDEDFAAGLGALLEGGAWRTRGARGREYVRQTFELERAIDEHEAAYRRVLANGAARDRAGR